MSHPRSPATIWCRRGLTLLLPMLMTGLLLAQNPKGKPPADDEEAKPKPKKKIADDDEEVKPKPKKKIDDDDGPKPMPKSKPVKPVVDEKIDLAAEAEKVGSPELKALYLELAHPFDRLYDRTRGWFNVVPVEVYVGERPNGTKVPYTPLLAPGKPDKLSTSAAAGELLQAKHYEQVAVDKVKEFLANGLTLKPGDRNYLPRLDQLTAANKLLTAAVQFSDAQRAAAKRKGGGWDALRESLRLELLNVLRDELTALDSASATDKAAGLRAAELAARIGASYPDNVYALRDVASWKLNQASGNLRPRDEEYIQGAQALDALQQKFPGIDRKVLEPLRDKLRRRAQAHLDEARKLNAEPDSKFLALRQIEMCELIFPDLEGLAETKTQLMRDYRLLVVGVRELPERMSPALAFSDADRWAVELLFESLINPVPDATVGHYYQPVLAARPPRLVSLGREFRLVPDAVWASKDGPGEPVTAYHVKKTIEMMQEQRGLPICARIDLLQAPAVQDRLQFRLNLERGYIEPLAAMAFKVLPTHILEKKPQKLLDPEFAADPVGSGPYAYHGRRVEDGREYAVFKANPAYAKRSGKIGLPRIQEIRFVVTPPNPVADLREGKIDLLLDLPTEQLANVRSPELARVVTDVTLRSQRIWMLAVNHRKPELGQEPGKPLRRALAHAVDREEIMRAFKANTLHHRSLNGPFPPDTWAVPSAPPPLFNAVYAQSMIKQAKPPERLTLKCANDPLAQRACDLIKQQIEQQNLGVRIDVVSLAPAALFQAVYLEHDYDLAYLPYDYNEVYSLSGLLDPEAMGRSERNFLGYTPDSNLAQIREMIRRTRNFSELRKLNNLLFTAFNEQMPFIPLWQFDFHMVVSQSLQTVPLPAQLDPHTIFDQVEEWRLNR